jgi:RimJ/RimL family protein N-acetyltransferase
MGVTIRNATLDDLEDLLDLREAVAGEGIWIAAELPLDRDGDLVKHRTTVETQADGSSALFLVAEADGSLVGSLVVLRHVGVGDLGMNIASAHRGLGIGSALLEAAVTWSRSAGLHKLQLEHWPWNHGARALYERAGFVEEGYRPRQYRRKSGALWDSVLMGLVLDHDAPGHPERASEPPAPA